MIKQDLCKCSEIYPVAQLYSCLSLDVDFELHDSVAASSPANDSSNPPSTPRDNSQGSLLLIKTESVKSKNSGGFNRRSVDGEMTFGGNANGEMTCSTDTLNSIAGETVTLRKKGTRLSFPAALNNASDKLFGKRKSGDSVKSKSSCVERPEKKEKKRLKHLFSSMKRTSSKKDLSRSVESGLNETGSISDLLDQSDDNHNNISSNSVNDTPGDRVSGDTGGGEVVFKPRYTPLSEKQHDSWHTGAPDAPLADSEGDESPLFLEPPVRSFPLSGLTPLPHHVHSDLYDTAFALASLRAGNDSSSSGLNYLNTVHAVVEEACKVTNNNNNHVTTTTTTNKVQDHGINKQDVDNTHQSLSLTEGNKCGRSWMLLLGLLTLPAACFSWACGC